MTRWLYSAISVTIALAPAGCSGDGGGEPAGAAFGTGGAMNGLGGAATSSSAGDVGKGGSSSVATGGTLGSGGSLSATSAGAGNGGTSQGTVSPGGVDCNPTHILCKRAAPSCEEQSVPSVATENNCYTGLCVPIGDCGCTTAADCPDPQTYTCNLSAKRCTPYL